MSGEPRVPLPTPRSVEEFEINEAILQIRADFAADKIDAECMEREIDFALRGLRSESNYLSIFGMPNMEKVNR
jgi:hypothetical protein